VRKSFGEENKQKNIGCPAGINATQIGMTDPLERISESAGPIFLYRCNKCISLWEENPRQAHLISEQEARIGYPNDWLE
jgi:hypothetical protein